jgi:hypothetical protein
MDDALTVQVQHASSNLSSCGQQLEAGHWACRTLTQPATVHSILQQQQQQQQQQQLTSHDLWAMQLASSHVLQQLNL